MERAFLARMCHFGVLSLSLFACSSGLSVSLYNLSPAVIVNSPASLKCVIFEDQNIAGDVTFFRGITAMCHVKQTVTGCNKPVSHIAGYICGCAPQFNETRVYFLKITEIQKDDGTRWGCWYHGQTSNFVQFPVRYPPSITSFRINSLISAILEEDSLVTMCCEVSSNPMSQTQILNGSRKMYGPIKSRNVTLSWGHAGCLDSGYYTCEANNGVLLADKRTASLIIQCSPRVDHRMVSKNNVVTSMNTNVSLRVFVIANPAPTFTWYRQYSTGRQLLLTTSPTVSTLATAVGEYKLFNVNVNDSGIHRVIVSNGIRDKLVVDFTVVVQGIDPNWTNMDVSGMNLIEIAISLGIMLAIMVAFSTMYVWKKIGPCRKEEEEIELSSSEYAYIEPDGMDSHTTPVTDVNTDSSETGYDSLEETQTIHLYETVA